MANSAQGMDGQARPEWRTERRVGARLSTGLPVVGPPRLWSNARVAVRIFMHRRPRVNVRICRGDGHSLGFGLVLGGGCWWGWRDGPADGVNHGVAGTPWHPRPHPPLHAGLGSLG